MTASIAVIGAGLAGATLARCLQPHARVTLIEKARGMGGRLATRWHAPYHFDHGAQYVIARDATFESWLEHYRGQHVVEPWHPRIVTLSAEHAPYKRLWFETHYVGVPGMHQLVRAIAGEVSCQLQHQVTGLERAGSGWQLMLADGTSAGPYDWVISTAPAPQSRALLTEAFAHQEALAGVAMRGCYTLMLGFDTALTFPFDAARVHDARLSWIALNHAKPGRDRDMTALVLHSTNAWAQAHMEAEPEAVQEALLEAATRVLATAGVTLDAGKAGYLRLHRWRYADTPVPVQQSYLLDSTHRLAACGDWCLGPRAECAFLSAYRLAAALATHL